MVDSIPPSESPERLARPLIRLAKACGVATSYIDQVGDYVENTDEALIGVLKALGIDASSPESILNSLDHVEQAASERPLPPTIVAHVGEPRSVTVNRAAEAATITLTLESPHGDDAVRELKATVDPHTGETKITLPDDLPAGYHTLAVDMDGDRAAATVICAPARIPLPSAVAEHRRWGWMTQLYSVRSHESWGVGDYGDLRRLAVDAAKNGADFMLINPIHACAPITPLEPSPYLPESRRFLNATYIRPQDIPEYADLDETERARVDELHAEVAAGNDDPAPMDINAAWDAKRQALRVIFEHPRSSARQAAFDQFKRQSGPDLDSFATWCVAFEVWGAPWGDDPWFSTLSLRSPETARLAREHTDLLEFNRWLQWIACEQVDDAQSAAKDAGMALGLMHDMAVGVHDLGADVWANPERFVTGVTVGCPPDFYNQQGQDWGQPPFNPNYLEETGYLTYREMVRSIFAHAGAVRIDHVLGLFRLWWIPAGHTAKDGAYVMYDHDAMLSVLAIEATRVGGMVIGENLGTVPDYVRQVLAERGVLGTEVEWFARVGNSGTAGDPYLPPSDYRRQALASVTTHDLPPTAGYLDFEHVRLRERLQLLTEPVEVFQRSAMAERDAMMTRLVEEGLISPEVASDVSAHEQEIVEAMHAMLTSTPSLLLQAALVDGVGEHRSQNQPGTSYQYPNWRIPLTDEHGRVVRTDEVFSLPRMRSLCAVMRGGR
ncbi:4-alpha-glucanotransferase [Bifidobacterium lemurum]|uniref:4-alpha-glucanotransferase n=1 Tax=Bifidobacterium lemurum TaxID=1603886 RepID=A0A261FRP3_9BIFI|nr:4-alpha-glucanotransferase [Bifidobacterium lemurum]OZG61827.1 4-alpha-glucanotransferase [Bifidobacterium lemurum]QOL34969.1 4-alpha-glucanotransferase [Bifidobacterium lemurum]